MDIIDDLQKNGVSKKELQISKSNLKGSITPIVPKKRGLFYVDDCVDIEVEHTDKRRTTVLPRSQMMQSKKNQKITVNMKVAIK